MRNWWKYHLAEVLVVLAIIAVLVLIGASSKQGRDQREAFMASCQLDRKEYECTALWRAGDPMTTVMPVPIVIPMNSR